MAASTICFGQKQEIIVSIEKGETQPPVCQRLGLVETTVSTIWRGRETLKRNMESSDFTSSSKRFCSSNDKDVNVALLAYFNNIPVNGPLLLKKARSLASALGDESFTASTVSECCLALDVVRWFHGESPHLQALNCLDELLYTVKRTCK